MRKNTSIKRLYLTRAKRACSSENAYLAMIPGVASGIFVTARLGFREIGTSATKTNAYLLRPADLMIQISPSGAA